MGERLRTVWEWRDWIALRGFDVAMPDVARTGLSEGKRIAALCDSFNLPIAPHVGGGGILCVAATIHYLLAIPQLSDHGIQPRGPRLEGIHRPLLSDAARGSFCRATGAWPWRRDRRVGGGPLCDLR